MRRRAKASQSDDEEQAERSASPHYASSEDEKAAEEPEEQNGEDGHDNATNDKEQETASNKKKEEKAKPEDPAFVPKSGRFFMHDDRAEDVKDSDARDQKKLWSEEEEEGVWLHDKFNELNVNSDRQKGRRNSYSKNSKYVNKRDNTYKDKHTTQQQYRRKTEAQPQTEPQQQTQQNHEQPKSSPRSTESKPIHTQSTSNGTKSYAQREQNYQPKSRGTTYRAKQSYNRNSDYSSAPSSNPKEGSKRYSSQRESSTTSQTTSTDHQQQVYQSTGSQDYPPSVQQYPKQQMRPSKSYVPRSNANTKQAPSTVPSSVPAPLPEEYNVISSASSMQYNYGYNVPAMASQYHQGVYNPYYPYQYPYPYIPSMPSVVPPTDPAIISQGSIQYYSVPYVEDPTTSKKAAPINDTNASLQTNKSQWVPKRSHAIPIKEPPQETKNSPSKSTQ